MSWYHLCPTLPLPLPLLFLVIFIIAPVTESIQTPSNQQLDDDTTSSSITKSRHHPFESLRHRHRHVVGVDGDKDVATHRELKKLSEPDWSYYHTATEIEDLVNEYASRHHKLVSVSYPYKRDNKEHLHHTHSVCHTHDNDRDDNHYCDGHRLQLVELSNRESPISDDKKLHVLLTFGEHGREIISSEIALELLTTLTNDPLHDKHTGYRRADRSVNDDTFLEFLLNYVHFYFIPLLNVWGHEQVEIGQTCVRKNINGVDPNRNYDSHFLYDPDIKLTSEQYPGIQPFSELESQYVRDVGKYIESKHKAIDLYINVHSGVKEMYYGYDYSPKLIPNHRDVSSMLELVNEKHCQCSVGGAGRIGGYVVHGGSMDYFYEQMKVPNSLTFEVYGGDSKHEADGFFDCFPFFNPTSLHDFHESTENWSWSFLTASAYLLAQKHSVYFPYALPQYLVSNSSLLQPHHDKHGEDSSGWPNFRSLQPKKDSQDIPPYVLMLSIVAAVIVVLVLILLVYRYLRSAIFGTSYNQTYSQIKERQSPTAGSRSVNV